MTTKKLAPVHPGEILLNEFLAPMNLSQNRIARDLGVPPRRINEIVLGKRRITADTALRLARYFRTSPELWLRLQMDYDLGVELDLLGSRLEREVSTYERSDGPAPGMVRDAQQSGQEQRRRRRS